MCRRALSCSARSILRRYSDAWFSANAARRGGNAAARYPRRRKSLIPSATTPAPSPSTADTSAFRWPVGVRPWACVFRDPSRIRHTRCALSRSSNVGPKLFVDVTAEVPVASYEEGMGPDPARVAGVDLGIIHPYAVAAEGAALVVSGRAIRAEHRLHLAERRPDPERWPPAPPNAVRRAHGVGVSTGRRAGSSKGVTGAEWPRPPTKRPGPWSTSQLESGSAPWWWGTRGVFWPKTRASAKTSPCATGDPVR